MEQVMLPIMKHARRITEDEMALRSALRELTWEIESVEREMVAQRKRLLNRMDHQRRNGLDIGEIEVTDDLIRERTNKLREHLNSLQNKYQAMIRKVEQVREQAQLQQDLGL